MTFNSTVTTRLHNDRVEEFKLLGVWVSANLTWNKHVDQMISKATSRLLLKAIKKGISAT